MGCVRVLSGHTFKYFFFGGELKDMKVKFLSFFLVIWDILKVDHQFCERSGSDYAHLSSEELVKCKCGCL